MTRSISRRTLIVGGAAAGLLAACAHAGDQAEKPPATPSPGPPTGHPPATAPIPVDLPAFTDLEARYGARLGVWALATGTGARVEHRPDERFAFCSTHKAFSAAAILRARTIEELDTVVRFSPADLIPNSRISESRVNSGMSLRELCDAAVRHSDNTAANLLFEQLGGPPGLASFLRSLGDTTTNCSRVEPHLGSAVPGDPRDTTTPRAWGDDLRQVTLGDALAPAKRDILVDWLTRNTTGDKLIRAGAPTGWRVGDKTGSGDYGTRNDIGVLWPPAAAPVVLAILSSRPDKDDPHNDHDELIAQAARAAVQALT